MRKILMIAALTLTLSGCGDGEVLRSEVHDKFYQSSSLSTGAVVGSNGQVGVVTTGSSSKHEVALDSGVHSVSEKEWVTLKVGQVIEYEVGFFGIKNVEVIEQ